MRPQMTFEQKCHVTDAGRQMTFYRCLDIRSYIISEWFVGVFEWKSTTVLMLLPALVLLVDTWNRPIAKLIEHKMTTGRQGNTRVILQWGWIWESEDILTKKNFDQTFNQCLSSNALCKATLLPLVEVSPNQNGEQGSVQLPNEVKLAWNCLPKCSESVDGTSLSVL